MRKIISLVYLAGITMMVPLCTIGAVTSVVPEFSKAGFFEVRDCGRDVFNFNVGWRFFKGTVLQAEIPGFDDSQ